MKWVIEVCEWSILAVKEGPKIKFCLGPLGGSGQPWTSYTILWRLLIEKAVRKDFMPTCLQIPLYQTAERETSGEGGRFIEAILPPDADWASPTHCTLSRKTCSGSCRRQQFSISLEHSSENKIELQLCVHRSNFGYLCFNFICKSRAHQSKCSEQDPSVDRSIHEPGRQCCLYSRGCHMAFCWFHEQTLLSLLCHNPQPLNPFHSWNGFHDQSLTYHPRPLQNSVSGWHSLPCWYSWGLCCWTTCWKRKMYVPWHSTVCFNDKACANLDVEQKRVCTASLNSLRTCLMVILDTPPWLSTLLTQVRQSLSISLHNAPLLQRSVSSKNK